MNPHGHSSYWLRNRVRLLLSFQRWPCVLRHETRILWLGFGAVTLTVLRPPCWTVHVTRVIAMFACRSLVLRMDKSWKDSAFMALGFCLHHSVGVMWAPHQLNEPFNYFWSAILVPWYSSYIVCFEISIPSTYTLILSGLFLVLVSIASPRQVKVLYHWKLKP
jgi:hypothetical protein